MHEHIPSNTAQRHVPQRDAAPVCVLVPASHSVERHLEAPDPSPIAPGDL